MTSPKAAWLWFLGGAALLAAGLIAEPRRPFAIAAGILFFVVGSVTIMRGREGA